MSATVELPFLRYEKSKKLILLPGADLLTVTVASNNAYTCKILLENEAFYDSISDDSTQSSLLVAVLCQNDCTMLCLQHKAYLRRQINIDLELGGNIFHSIFQLRRLEIAQFVYSFFLNAPHVEDDFKREVLLRFLVVDDLNCSVLQCVGAEDESFFAMLGGTRDENQLIELAHQIERPAEDFLKSCFSASLQEALAKYQQTNRIAKLSEEFHHVGD